MIVRSGETFPFITQFIKLAPLSACGHASRLRCKTFILTSETIKKLNVLLNLPYMEWMQDWDIELADPSRLEEFIKIYLQEPLTSDEKRALMSLIIASFEGGLKENGSDPVQWGKIRGLLEKDYDLHEQAVSYWSCLDADLIDEFTISPLMRALRDSKLRVRPT